MKKQKLAVIAGFFMVAAFVFTACEGQEGPEGPPGQGALAVWDSSTPPQLLGRYITSAERFNSFYLITPKDYIIRFNLYGDPHRYRIYFSEPNQAGDPFCSDDDTFVFNQNGAIYNGHDGGTYYAFTSDRLDLNDNYYDDQAPIFIKSYYDYDWEGTKRVNDNADERGYIRFMYLYKLRKTTPEEIGLPRNIVHPLKIK